MALWLLRGVRRGIVTTRYPRQPEPSATDLPTPPAFVAGLLTAELAEQLELACPCGALRRGEGSLVLDLGACTACGACWRIAPDAVRPSGVFELATADRERLRKTIPIAGDSR